MRINGHAAPRPLDMISPNFANYKTLRTIDLRENNISEFSHRKDCVTASGYSSFFGHCHSEEESNI